MPPAPASGPIVAVTSKPPVMPTTGGWRDAGGGVAPIVRSTLARRGSAWVSWDGGWERPPSQLQGFSLATFSLAPREADRFYNGYANRTLWPIFHELDAPLRQDATWWSGYRGANEAYARAAADVAAAMPDASLWVHDYHLLLAPTLLRDLGSTNPMAFFLHTPFPSPSIFARVPQRVALLAGLAGADLLGFQTERDKQRFVATWDAFGDGPCPSLVTVPASIDVTRTIDGARDPRTVATAKAMRRRLPDGQIVILGVERLDYTKGIVRRLLAFERLLIRRPDLRRRVTYVQIAPPTRSRVPEYESLRNEVEREISRINGKLTAPGGDVPIHYLHRQLTTRQLMAYYLLADVALVTPLRDGMNLVAKELVVAQAASDGAAALVLSEFAGAADELVEAVPCNPFDLEGMAIAFEHAIDLDPDDRRKRMSAMADTVAAHDVTRWADLQMEALAGAS